MTTVVRSEPLFLSTLPGRYYYDPAIYALELEKIFSSMWVCAGRADTIAKPGAYQVVTIGTESVIVVRNREGVLNAFLNVCRHRGSRLCTATEGHLKGSIQCRYHAWTYGLDGSLKGVPDFEGVGDFDRKQNGLVPLSVDVWEKFVFVQLDPNPMLQSEYVGEMVEQFRPLHLDGLHFAGRREWIIDCNWKVFVDNYLDGGYHVPYLHKGLNSILDYATYTITNGARFCLQSSPISSEGEGVEKMTASVRTGQALYYWLYPNFMLNWYEGYLDTNLVLPLGIDKMKVIL